MKIIVGLIVSISVLLAGCGGGESQIPAADPLKVTIEGVAAMGSPMAGASILVVDATGSEVCKATAGKDGAYTCALSANAKSPLVVSATNGDVTYYAPLAEFKSGTVNLTKLTTLIAAQLSPTGEPSSLAAQIRDGSAKVTAAELKQKTDDLSAALQPLLTNAGNDIDPISGKFSADGTGHDKALMALDILIKPTNGKSNINVTVKTEFTIGTELPAITFVSGEKPPKLPESVATNKLPAYDEDTLIANFIKRANDCYALPKSTRVSVDNKNVIALECRGLFPADEPNNYKDDGNKVGPTGAFSNLFSEAATGISFVKPEVEFRYKDDQIRLRLSVKQKNGDETFQRLRVKLYGSRYRALGNQYDYEFWVRPWTEERKLINRNDLNYYSTGFNVYVNNYQSNGISKFTKVIVTPPGGFTPFELFPSPALDYLLIKINGTQYPTNILRLAGRYISTPGTVLGKKVSLPRDIAEGLIWLSSPSGNSGDWSDLEIDQIPELTRWKADFYLTDGTIATQYYETGVGPLTIPELIRSRWAQLTDANYRDFVSKSMSSGGVNFANGYISYPVTWAVPEGAYSPSLIQTQGISSSTRFNDNLSVMLADRTGVISCSAQSVSDKHCESQLYIDNISLFAADKRNMLFASQYFSYKLSQ